MTTPESLEVMLMSPRVPVDKLFGDLHVGNRSARTESNSTPCAVTADLVDHSAEPAMVRRVEGDLVHKFE